MKSVLRKLIIIAALLALWQAAAFYVNLEVLLPSPLSVLQTFLGLLMDVNFYKTSLLSLARVVGGFSLAVIFGVLAALLSSRSIWIKDACTMLLSIIKAAPVASFIILALVWLEKGRVPVLASFLIVAPMVFSNVYTGIIETPKDLLEMSRAFGVKRSKILHQLYIPSVMPYFISASSTAMGMAWKAGIAAEVIASPRFSIGGNISDAKIYLNTPDLFAWTIAVIILSVFLEGFLKRLAVKRRFVND